MYFISLLKKALKLHFNTQNIIYKKATYHEM